MSFRAGAAAARYAPTAQFALARTAAPFVVGGVAHYSAALEKFAPGFSKQQKQKNGEPTKPKERLNINRFAVIGGGNMAEAVITGLLAEDLIDASKIVVSDPNPEMRKKYTSRNIGTSDVNSVAVKDADVVVLAVKPQVLTDVMESFKSVLRPNALVLSVVAGATIDGMLDVLGDNARVIRTMPNTPAMIGEGMTVWSQSNEVTEDQHALTKSILGAFGVEVFVDDESALDMATALSGSGPAYFFLVAEAMIDTGVHMGFSRAVATKLVQQTMLGSALYMQSSDAHPVILRNAITSPGGTTAAALYRAEKNGFRAVIADSIWALPRAGVANARPAEATPDVKGQLQSGIALARVRATGNVAVNEIAIVTVIATVAARDHATDSVIGIATAVAAVGVDATNAEDLKRAFSRREGDVRDVYIPKDFGSNQPRGFAFIEFNDAREAREVKYEMDRTKLNGQEIAVLFAQQRRKTPDQMRDAMNAMNSKRSLFVREELAPTAQVGLGQSRGLVAGGLIPKREDSKERGEHQESFSKCA
ncbi:TPA: hypothetical protein N0F65_005518 [Lagenidium giganteum]|uniref:RRM domain-containing protein n=1 Tax=Lagenidium giganteum TaxID=4803 RepID=A0AAV2YGZ1_9STRA|nr:TPA: hypothetical protein N0F65_005518 [Lagenidium giganteum]